MTASPPNTQTSPLRERGGSWWRPGLIGLAAVGLLTTGVLFRAQVTSYLTAMLEFAEALGPWGAVAVGGFYVLACVLFLPGSLVTLGSGLLFGVVKGTIVTSLGSTAGAAAAFLIGRTLARGWVARKIAGNARFRAIDEAVEREGFKIVLLTRLSPVFPFNLLNYALGLTRVKLWQYVLASWIGMLPGTVMYVYLGSAARSLTELSGPRERTTAEHIFFWAGMVVAVAVAVVVARIARRALTRAAPTTGPAAQEATGNGSRRHAGQ